jgi:hypothetical protein
VHGCKHLKPVQWDLPAFTERSDALETARAGALIKLNTESGKCAWLEVCEEVDDDYLIARCHGEYLKLQRCGPKLSLTHEGSNFRSSFLILVEIEKNLHVCVKGIFKRLGRGVSRKQWGRGFCKSIGAEDFTKALGPRILQRLWGRGFHKSIGEENFAKLLGRMILQKHWRGRFLQKRLGGGFYKGNGEEDCTKAAGRSF